MCLSWEIADISQGPYGGSQDVRGCPQGLQGIDEGETE